MINEAKNKISFKDKLKIFTDDVHEYFTTYYNNYNDNEDIEDTKEACLIRYGLKIVKLAERIINDQDKKIDRLNSIIRNLSLSINKQVLDAQDEILEEFIKQLINENSTMDKIIIPIDKLYKIKKEVTMEDII